MSKKQQYYHIVNPAGAIHVVDRDHARRRLGELGYRLATEDEVAEYNKRNGNQIHDNPIVVPFTTEPPELPLLPDEEVEEKKPAKKKSPEKVITPGEGESNEGNE